MLYRNRVCRVLHWDMSGLGTPCSSACEKVPVPKLPTKLHHGTSEQYHSEFKGEIGMERLPSGKLAVNRTVMLLGMAAYNILRRIGADALNCGIRISVRKEVARRRIRKVIQDVIRIACKFVETGRSKIVRLASASPWTPVLERLYHAYT